MKYLLGKIDRKLKSASTVCPKLVLKPATWTSLVAQLIKIPPTMWETSVRSLGWEDHLEKGKATHSSILAGEFHRLYSPWGRKESDKTEQLSLLLLPWCLMGFPGGSDGKESACNAGDLGSVPGLGRSPGEGNVFSTPVFLPGKSHGQRSLEGFNSWGHKE